MGDGNLTTAAILAAMELGIWAIPLWTIWAPWLLVLVVGLVDFFYVCCFWIIDMVPIT